MAEAEQTAQAAAINTSQPTPLRGLVIRGHHKVETVTCELPDRDGRTITVNKDDYDEKKHGKIIEAKLPARKKKVSAKKAAEDDSDEGTDGGDK